MSIFRIWGVFMAGLEANAKRKDKTKGVRTARVLMPEPVGTPSSDRRGTVIGVRQGLEKIAVDLLSITTQAVCQPGSPGLHCCGAPRRSLRTWRAHLAHKACAHASGAAGV
ncbi:hypothetical protein [Piscinibacter sp.]|uniref:hypothetical protein n=1 Tax=Piscinibacter sp. TaxID=1903157 RepID=UPI003559C6D7